MIDKTVEERRRITQESILKSKADKYDYFCVKNERDDALRLLEEIVDCVNLPTELGRKVLDFLDEVRQ